MKFHNGTIAPLRGHYVVQDTILWGYAQKGVIDFLALLDLGLTFSGVSALCRATRAARWKRLLTVTR